MRKDKESSVKVSGCIYFFCLFLCSNRLRNYWWLIMRTTLKDLDQWMSFCVSVFNFGPLAKIVKLKLYGLYCPVSTCLCASNRERPWPLYMTMQYFPISGWFLEIRLWCLKLKELSLVGCLADMLGLWNQACAFVRPLGGYFTNL